MRVLRALFVCFIFASAGVIHPQLAEKLQVMQTTDEIEIIVHMKNRPDLGAFSKGTSKAEKLLYLQEYAEHDQQEIYQYIATVKGQVKDVETFWIFNGFYCVATKQVIEQIAAREDVWYVIDNFNCYLQIEKPDGGEKILAPEWNISKVSAPQCWNDGFDGAGIILGNIDTGVDVDHTAFGGRWISGGWHDPINGQPDPYDDHGHGTHTMGTMCGGDGNGPFADDIGVAPGANFIAAKG